MEHTTVTLVGVDLEFALGEVEVVLGNDLVQGEFTTTQNFASAAVAENVSLFGDFDRVLDFAAMALSLVFRHGGS